MQNATADGINITFCGTTGKEDQPERQIFYRLRIAFSRRIIGKDKELLDVMGWTDAKKGKPKTQRTLFIEMTDDEKKIIALLQEKEAVPLDEINISSGLTSSAAAAAILNLELQNVVASLPGKMLKLV